ncbi:MAG: hypothetical protein ACTS78_03265 [Arsenophonus sp. NC-WZS1-MAG3]
MMINLRRQATITPKIRASLQAREEPVSTLLKRYEIFKLTVTKGETR